jgi:hypothetical protein
MKSVIHFALSNFTLTLLVLGLIASFIHLLRAPKPITRCAAIEALISYFVLFPIGISFFYNFVMHTFFGEMAAHFIGWQNSPFQLEVGFASLGYAVVGLLAFRRSFDLRLAAILGTAMFQLGAAGGHVYQMVTAHNFAPGNAGVMFYSDLALPAIGFVLLWLQRHCERQRSIPASRQP